MRNSKLIVFAVVAAGAAVGVGAASAADLAARPYTKAPMMAAMYDWSGFYIGGNGGGGSTRDCRTNITAPLVFGCHDATGGVAGGQIGYRWQSGAWVFGLEAQGDWADLTGSAISLLGTNNVRSKMDSFGLFTGQVGYAWNNALVYVKGGAAITSNRYDFTTLATNTVISTASDNSRWGGAAGVGLEYGFTPNWSVALEYDHLFSGSNNNLIFTTVATGVPIAATFRSGGDTDLGTVRINYRFGGPVVGRY
jgi:outer membrane immunogenic protein